MTLGSSRRCSQCEQVKPITNFRIENKQRGVRKYRCNTCENARMRADRLANGERRRASDRTAYSRRAGEVHKASIQRRFSINPAQAEAVSKAKSCEICGRGNGRRKMAVDHCHKTGVNRGVLCDRCNIAIGHLMDNPALIRRAAEYVEAGGFGFFNGGGNANAE